MPEDAGYGARDTDEEVRREIAAERRERRNGHTQTLGVPQLPLVCLWCGADWPHHLEDCPGKEGE